MTKKLQEILNIEDEKKLKQTQKEMQGSKPPREAPEEMRDISDLDKISSALPAVRGLGKMADDELDEVAAKAIDAYEDLMDLGMNVESRYSGRVFEVASSFLKTNLEAKTAKIDKKLKMIELQLKKEKQEKGLDGESNVVAGEGYVVTDRNSLIEKLKNIDK